ncbi:MAG: Crp/Fnr family transcriptional regulator [Pyrinomonadaceae bacterium]
MKKFPAEFPKGDHQNCQTLTDLVLEHLPRDGSHGRARRFAKGAEVWRPDDRADSIFFLLDGQVAVIVGDVEGKEVVLRVVEAGEPFGELCFCGGPSEERQTTVRTVKASEAVEIKLGIFMNYLQEHRDVLAAFVFTFCIRLADAERRIEVLAHRGATERLGRLLLHLANSRGTANAGRTGEVVLSVSHDELAQMAAMSRPHITVTMGKLRQHELVRYERHLPLVVDVLALTDFLNSPHANTLLSKGEKK